MGGIWQDVRFAARMLGKNPGFAVIAVITLALGIGANSALFSVVNGVLLNPLPFQNPQKLVAIYKKMTQFKEASIPYTSFLDWQKANRTLASMGVYREEDYSLTGQGEPERLHGQMISAGFFSTLGIKPFLGRVFRPEEDQIGAAPVVLISEGLWKRKFGSSRDVLGRAMELGGTAYTIVGVVPGRLPMFLPSDVFVPIGQWGDPNFRDRRIGMGTQGVARLNDGVSLAQARANMDSIAHDLAVTYPDADKDTGITIVPLKEDIVGDFRGILLILLGAVGFVLLIACANVANLLLARSTGRSREFAVRVALGASQMRVVRQLLTESVLLAVTGGLLGLAIAQWGTHAVLAAMPETLPRAEDIHVDARVLIFTLAVSIFAGIIFGLAPALKTRKPELTETLKEGGRGSTGTHHRTQSIFVVGEIALSLVLLIGAGLMIRSLAALWSVNPGFNPRNVLTFSVGFSRQKTANAAAIRAALRDITAKYESVPGIVAASASGGSLPMRGDSELPFWLEGQPKPASMNDMNLGLWYPVQPDYLQAMGIPLLRGRFIGAGDTDQSPAVIVIDENFAREFFPHQDPIGKRINIGLLNLQPEIIGVVGHIEHWGLGDTAHKNLQAQFYSPLVQLPDTVLPLIVQGINMVARTAGPPSAFAGGLREASLQFDPSQVAYDFMPMTQIVSGSIAAQRFTMILLGTFAALALLLSAVGIYGVISYLAAQRTHEIGIRMALGAQPSSISRMILMEGMKFALIGVAVGLAAALALTRLMSQMIFGVGAFDPLTFAGVSLLLIVIAMAACYIPARRAMHTDPMIALRYE